MKKSLFLFVGLLLLSLGVFAGQAPESLSMKGSALAESSEALLMKKIDNGFELITSLKTGTYSFEGDNSISEETIIENTSMAPYRIRVNYEGDTPTVKVEKIERVIMWAPWRQYTISELEYIGESRFRAEKLECIATQEGWGDNRYRIRIFFENDKLETYGPKDGVDFVLVGNGQWGEGNDFNYGMEDKYKNTGKLFNIELFLQAEGDYTHIISDYISEDVLFIKGTALEESDEPVQMKEVGNGYEIFTSLRSGNYSFEGDENLTGEYSISVENDSAPYYITVKYKDGQPEVKVNRINRVTMFVPRTERTFAELVYAGNSTFKAEGLTVDSKSFWDDDRRFRIKLFMEDETIITYGSPDKTHLQVTTNAQWGDDENGKEMNCELSLITFNDPTKAFNLTVLFSAESDYKFVESYDYNVDLPLCDNIWLEGNAVENMEFTLRKKINGSVTGDFEYEENIFEGVIGLQQGVYTIKGQKEGTTRNFTVENGRLVEGNEEITVENDLTPYYVKIDLNSGTIRVSPISSFKFWYICNDTKISLDYKGNGTFVGFSDDFRLTNPWDDRLEKRYKYMMTFEGNYEVWWGRTNEDNMFSHIDSELEDRFEPAFQFSDDTDPRTTWTVNFAENGNYNQQYQFKRYLLEDKVPFSNQSAIENASVRFTRNGLGAGEYSTLYLPFATTLENVEVYAFSNSDENTINFEKVERVEANTPYLIKPTVNMDLVIEEENVTLEATTTESTVGDNVYSFLGTYENRTAESGMYGISPTTNSFVQAGDNVTIPAFRAYLKALDAPSAAPSLAIGIEDGGTTDMPAISVDGLNVYAINKVLYVISDVQTIVNIYSVDGRIVRSEKVEAGINGINGLQQGVYIVNTQKVVIR